MVPRFFRCLILIWSGPVELLFLDCFIALPVCSGVITIGVEGSFSVCLSIDLLLRWVLCWITLVNCLLNMFAFCWLVTAILLLKVIVVFGFVFGFLFDRSANVFQSLCEFVLWSQLSSRCCCQRSILCCSIALSISVLRAGSDGSVGFCCLVVFLRVILSLMCCGKSLCLEWSFPLGMWCLSALSMMLVRILLAW